MPGALAAALDACLPQTQCTRCGYPRCHDYALALSRGETRPNRCPPGGDTTLEALASLLGARLEPLDPDCGEPGRQRVAVIDEQTCIGCALCLPACPVDAIVGGAQQMHTVIESGCSGCELCVPVCPVDCIVMQASPVTGALAWPGITDTQRHHWRAAEQAHGARAHHAREDRRRRRRDRAARQRSTRIREEIAAAVARVRSRRDGEAESPGSP